MMLALAPIDEWGRLAKVVTPTTVEPARMPREFQAAELPDLRTPREVFQLVNLLRSQPNVMLVRGTLRYPDRNAPVRRKYRDGGDIVAIPRRVLMYDFDDLGECETVADGLAKAIRRLPGELAAGDFMGVATAKAKPGNMRLRVISVLSAPASDRHCRAALWAISDTSLYNPVQPHFTADPIFAEGASDPFNGERVAYLSLPGEAAIVAHDDLSGEATMTLEQACRRIAAAKEGNRHKLVNSYAFRIGQYGEHAPQDAVNKLYQAALSAGVTPDRARDEIMRAHADGMSKPADGESWQSRLERGPTGRRLSHEVNARIILANDPRWRDRAGYSKATCSVEWIDPPANCNGSVEVPHLGACSEDIFARHGVALTTETLHRAISGLAVDNAFDPKREWLNEQPYDGQPRIDLALHHCLGAEDNEYTRGVSRELFLGIARRVLYPGSQHDTLTVLEGAEGIGKSTFFRMLGGEWHTEIKDIHSEDYIVHLRRAVIAELAELAAIKRVDEERFKQLVTDTYDTWRPKYARAAVALPRSCVFVATTNPPPGSRYLTGRLGNRRFLPVWVAGLHRERAAEWLPLCLGEAREVVLASGPGGAWAPVPGALAMQESRELLDPWQDAIASLTSHLKEVTLGDLCTVMEIAPERRHSSIYVRLESCLVRLGWTQTNNTTKLRARLWARKVE
jgi:predicted P-loop ATPase